MLDAFAVSVSPIAAQGELELQIRDGASAAGTVLWQLGIILPVAAGARSIVLSNLGIIGSPNTAMTIEFATAPAAGNFQRVNASGYNAL